MKSTHFINNNYNDKVKPSFEKPLLSFFSQDSGLSSISGFKVDACLLKPDSKLDGFKIL